MCVNFWETARICTNSVISRQLNTEVALLEWDVAGKDAMCMCPGCMLQPSATLCPTRICPDVQVVQVVQVHLGSQLFLLDRVWPSADRDRQRFFKDSCASLDLWPVEFTLNNWNFVKLGSLLNF